MPVKERLSRVRLYTLAPLKLNTTQFTIQEDTLTSAPFIIPKRRSETKFTGRLRELDYIRTLYSEVLLRLKKQRQGTEINHKPVMAAVKGEAGIGKSRLVMEFINRLKHNNEQNFDNILYGGCLSSGQNSYGLFSEILKTQKKPFKNSVHDDGNNLRLQNYIKEILFTAAYSANKQNLLLIVLFEDMQWADESSLAVLEHIVRSINLYTGRDRPQILFILNYRNKFRPSKVLKIECDFREIELGGFTETESGELIKGLTGSKTISTKTKEMITSRSDGSPFNIEEWCSLFNERRSLSGIPGSVQSVLVEKVKSLNSEERAVIITGSVLGKKFELKILNEMLARAGKEHSSAAVMKNLVEKRFLINLSGDVYEFRHDILQETIYRHLTPNVKEDVHLIAGNSIEALFPNRLGDYYYELARHYTEAKSVTKSVEYLEKAGDKAKNNYEHERALRYYEKLLKCIDKDKRYSIIFKMCDVYMNRCQWNKQIELCTAMLKENFRLDKSLKAESYKRIGHALRLKGDYVNALQQYKKAYLIYENNNNAQGKLDIMEHEAKIMMAVGKFKKALRSFEIIYKISKKNNFIDQYKNSLIGLGVASSKIAKYSDTIKFNDELYKFSLLRMDKQGMLTSQINKAEAFLFMGKHSEAYNLYSIGLKKSHEVRNYQDIANCHGNLGILLLGKSNFKKAVQYFYIQLESFIVLNDKPGECRAYGLLGSCHISMGNYSKAIYYLSKQLKFCKDLKRVQSEALCLANLGVVYNLLGEFSKAQQYFYKQIRIDRKIHNVEGLFRFYYNMAVLYKNQKRNHLSDKYMNKAQKIASINNLQNHLYTN